MADSRTHEKSKSIKSTVNSDEPSVTCTGCAELELELKKTQIELKSTEKIMELLHKEIKQMEDTVPMRCLWDAMNKCNQQDYEISQCFKCVEGEVHYQEALLEIRSLKSIIKLLHKELGITDSKSEVMVDTDTMIVEMNSNFNSEKSTECIRYNNLRNGNKELLCAIEDVTLKKKREVLL
jgi:hypothetical protein